MGVMQTTELKTDDERRLAREASRALATHLTASFRQEVRIGTGSVNGESVTLPDGAVRMLQHALEALSTGQRLTVTTREAEVSTQEAADLLRVSRPYLIRLLEQGDIPFRMVGSHRRINLQDVLYYEDREFRAREAILDELVGEAQELGLGY